MDQNGKVEAIAECIFDKIYGLFIFSITCDSIMLSCKILAVLLQRKEAYGGSNCISEI